MITPSNIFLGVIIATFTLIVDIKTDLNQWGSIKHVRGALLRCIGLVPASILLGWFTPLILSLYLLFFDGIIGVKKKLGFFYAGNSAFWDRNLFSKLSIPWRAVIKFGLIIISLVLIYLKYKK